MQQISYLLNREESVRFLRHYGPVRVPLKCWRCCGLLVLVFRQSKSVSLRLTGIHCEARGMLS